MVRLFKCLTAKDWILIALIVLLVCGQVYCDLALPDYMGEIIVLIRSQSEISDIMWIGGKMLLITLVSVACTVAIGYCCSRVSAAWAMKTRRNIFGKINEFSLEEINQFSTSSLITRSTNDITQVQMVLMMMLRFAIMSPIMAVSAIIKITGKSMTLSLVTACGVFAMLGLILFMVLIVIPKFSKLQKQTDKINLVSRENLTGLRIVRAYNAEDKEAKKFEEANEEITKTQLFVNKATSIMMPGMQLIMSGLALAIVWIGSYLVNNDPAFFADMTVFTQYSMQVLISFMMLSMTLTMLPRAIVSARRINEVMKTEINIKDGAVVESVNEGKIEFKNVSFKYPLAEENVLDNISFSANSGEIVAFIGSTGSGKTTLVNLIPRFYDVVEGEVLVDGVNVKDYKLESLYNKLGYVPQKGVLFSGSIEENIKYGKADADADEVQKALEVSQSWNFVNDFEQKTNHHISQGGKNVSGGQKQRLSIARAIVKKPEIYIFDDSFSALDYKTDKVLRKELKEYTNGATTLIVAQRIGTIIDADKIIVLDEGRIVGQGNHKDLIKNCKVYQEIAYSQLSKEELENEK